MHFERLIRAHFKARAPKILRVCRAYLDEGCPIGQYDARAEKEREEGREKEKEKDEDGVGGEAETPGMPAGASTSGSRAKPSRPSPTEGFKLTLRKLVPRLEAAFKANDELVDASGV